MSEGQKDAGRVTGLTDGEAAAIRKTAGRNTVHRGKKQNPLKLFAGQLGDLMTMILLVFSLIQFFIMRRNGEA